MSRQPRCATGRPATPRPAARPSGRRLSGPARLAAALAALGIAACRGVPTADLAGRPAWPKTAGPGPAPAYAADPAAGARRFADHCTACHGPAGGGDGPLAAGLSPRPPDWTVAGALQSRSPASLYQAITRGVLGTSMKRYDHILDPPSAWDVVFHVWRLPVDEATLRRGADAYAQRCAACHGAAGVPDDVQSAPSLVRPEWVSLTRTELVDAIGRAHPEVGRPIAGGGNGAGGAADAAAIAEHLWSFLTMPAGGDR